MSSSPGALVQRTLDLNYDEKRRASSMRWLLANCALLALLLYDLWGGWGALAAAEAALAALSAASLAAHAARLWPARRARLPLRPRQRRLLGLPADRLDSSFRLVEDARDSGAGSDSEAPASLSPPRAWRRADSSPPAPAGDSPPAGRAPADRFVASARALARYLRAAAADPAPPPPPAGTPPRPVAPPPYRLATPPPYQLAAPADQQPAQPAAREPQLWRRLDLDPQRLTQFNLNLRLWLSATVLRRVAREAAAAARALALHGLAGLRLERAALDRLRALHAPAPQLAALLPFLEAFPDQDYAVQRIKELAQGGCMSAYRWDGGGSDWHDARPTDAELVLHLFATYMDLQMPGAADGAARAFSSAHLSAAPALPARGPTALAIHRTARRPPHYVLVLGATTLEACAGRANLLHTLLLFLAAAARRPPPTLRRLHLGPAGLNMLWIIGR